MKRIHSIVEDVPSLGSDSEFGDLRILSENTMGFSGASVRQLLYTTNDSGGGRSQSHRLFLKTIEFAAGPPKDLKDERNRFSYTNEQRFLRHYAPAMRATGLVVPRVLKTSEDLTEQVRSFGSDI
jgi:hypothetical protein